MSRPAYPAGGPTVAIDEAHDNFHTLTGRYEPFVALLRADGYRVVPFTSRLELESLEAVDVLVIANARNLAALMAGELSASAFTEDECDAVADWVRGGGSLLLIADHAPFGAAAEALARRFGVGMGEGWTFDVAEGGGVTTILDFSGTNGGLGDHAIIRGRDSSEAISVVRAFTGQSISGPAGAHVLMRLSPSAREVETPDDLNVEDAARREESESYGQRSRAVGGLAQGLALRFGRGRIVVLGEAAMLSAQIVRFSDGREIRAGMNVAGNDNSQFALNVMRWLSGVLDDDLH